MRPTTLLAVLFGSAFSLLSHVHAADAPPTPQTRPNVVFIVTDDQARWALGCYGNSECKTPNMDRIAASGVKFTNAFVVTPVCSPSRASLFSGRFGTELGITDWINDIENKVGVGLDPDVPTWPRTLQQAG